MATFLCFYFNMRSHLHCRTVSPCPGCTAAPVHRGTQCGQRGSLVLALLVAPVGMASLPPRVFIMTEAQPKPPELEDREEIHVLSSV